MPILNLHPDELKVLENVLEYAFVSESKFTDADAKVITEILRKVDIALGRYPK